MTMIEDHKRQTSEFGQSLVEFVLGSVILALTVAAIVDLGRAYFVKIAITDAAAEGAMFAAYSPNCLYDTGWASCADPNNVTYRVKHASDSRMVDWNSVQVATMAGTEGLVAGSNITVTVNYPFTLITPFISGMVGSDILQIRASAVQSIR